MRRVVITGVGAITSLGVGAEHIWQNLLASKSGISHIDRFDVSDLPAKIAGCIVRGDGSGDTFDTEAWV